MNTRPPFVGILLAAGRSTRYGNDKLLALLPSGETLALAAARHLREGLGAGARLLAVLRPEQVELAATLAAAGYEPVFGEETRAGMGRSLAVGVAASPEAGGWLVALADMPAIEPLTIARVAAALQAGASLAAPFHDGRRGHPVGFAAGWRQALTGLDGDVGARELLREAGETLQRIDTEDPGVLLDVDTPADLPPAAPATAALHWTDRQFEAMSWHDNHVHALRIVEGEHGAGELVLDLDYVLEWVCAADGCQFRIVPATLRFFGVTGLRIALDYARPSAALGPFAIHAVERRIEPRAGYVTQHWTMAVSWPEGEIAFEAAGFEQHGRGAPRLSRGQFLRPEERLG